MSEEISSPLANIIKAAMSSKPNGPLAEIRAKLEKRTERASDVTVVLADCSGSMFESIGALQMTKYDHLQVALKDVLRFHPGIRVVAFNSGVQEVKGGLLPMPVGGTDLAGALKHAARWKPKKTIIISDGIPDNEPAAVREADRMTGMIDTIYCGPDAHPAIEFLRSLSRDTGGVSIVWDGHRSELSSNIRGLITG